MTIVAPSFSPEGLRTRLVPPAMHAPHRWQISTLKHPGGEEIKSGLPPAERPITQKRGCMQACIRATAV
jgi:hypothetical protein